MIILRKYSQDKQTHITSVITFGTNCTFRIEDGTERYISMSGIQGIEYFYFDEAYTYDLNQFLPTVEKHLGENKNPLYIDYTKTSETLSNPLIFNIGS